MLDRFDKRLSMLSSKQRRRLDDSGLAGTCVHYEYSYHTARWLSERYHDQVEINWDEYDDPERLDSLLVGCLAPTEEEAFDEGELSTQDWVELARGAHSVTGLEWLMQQALTRHHAQTVHANLYDAADVPLIWNLADGPASVTHNRAATTGVRYRRKGMRRLRGSAVKLVTLRLPGIELVKPGQGQHLIEVAMAALAARHREVHSMTHANPREVYLAPLGRGAQVVIMGVVPEFRLNLESNYGYLLLSNGVPVGYGGVSPLFSQANTGINIVDEYRKSEAAFLFAQTLRTFRTLFGCRHLVVNPYQFGADNAEAISSGAFWFYYRLGFRPADAPVRELARTEYARVKQRPQHRTDRRTLRALANSDLVLALPDARRTQFFPEKCLVICSTGVTRLIARQKAPSRQIAIARAVARTLGIQSMSRWPADERTAFGRMAPIVGLLSNLAQWSHQERQQLVKLMRAKGVRREKDYAVRLREHERFRLSLGSFCRSVTNLSVHRWCSK